MKRNVCQVLLAPSTAVMLTAGCAARTAPVPAPPPPDPRDSSSQSAPAHPTTVVFADLLHGWAGSADGIWGHQRWRQDVERRLGRTLVRFASEVTGWALFCYGQGAGSQEPYLLYRTDDGGQTWTPQLMGRWLFGEPAPLDGQRLNSPLQIRIPGGWWWTAPSLRSIPNVAPLDTRPRAGGPGSMPLHTTRPAPG
jgi:hypothetical protein